MPKKIVVGQGDDRFGVAIRRRGGFQFIAAHDDFASLDGLVFRRARTLVKEVARTVKRRRNLSSLPRDETRVW